MPARLRVIDIMESGTPQSIGLCQSDVASLCQVLNEALPKLIQSASDVGWFGTFAEMVFNVDQANPYITTPREVARLISMDVCSRPVPIRNQFFEYLEFGSGHMPKTNCKLPAAGCGNLCSETYSRNNAVTFTELVPGNKIIRVYPTDERDGNLRTLIQGVSGTVPIRSTDGAVEVDGVFVNLIGPFQDTPMEIESLTGIQKDTTYGQVKYFSVDTVTGDSVLLLTMEPGEKTASYRRYFLDRLPKNCCQDSVTTTVQVKAIAKLDFVPVSVPTDYTIINNLAAIRCECESLRFQGMDRNDATILSLARHKQAVRHLNNELGHYVGRNDPSVNFAPFGSAKLRYASVNMQ